MKNHLKVALSLLLALTTGAIAGGVDVRGPYLTPDSVKTANIKDGEVQTADIQNSAVDTDKLATDAVSSVKIINSAVTTAKIADSAVDTAKLAADSVTNAKLLNDAASLAKVSNQVVVNSGGNIGVGQANPGYKLDVTGDSHATGQLIVGGTATVKGNAFSVGGSTLVINEGRVGINTNSPNQALDVVGAATISSSLTVRGTGLRLPADGEVTIITDDAADNAALGITGGGGAGTSRGARLYLAGNERSSNPGDLFLQAGAVSGGDVRIDANGAADALVIADGGNVGIGMISPGTLLQVRGTISSTSTIVGNSILNSDVTANSPRLAITATAATGDELAIVHSGNDASTPLVRFHKNRSTSLEGSANTVVQNGDPLGQIVFMGADGSDYRAGGRLQFSIDGTPGASDMPGRFAIFTTPDGSASSTERMRITSAGNVGINTEEPGTTLHVQGTVTSSRTFVNTSSVDSDITAAIDAPAVFIQGPGASINGIAIVSNGDDGISHPLQFFKTRSAAPGGDANTPVQSGDSLGFIDGWGASNDGTYKRGAIIEINADAAPASSLTPGRITFYTSSPSAGDQERMRITSAGNIGIGVTAPGSKLDVSGTTSLAGAVTVSGSTLTVGGNAFSVGGSTFAVTGGRVGIGTSAPGNTLEINQTGGSGISMLRTSFDSRHIFIGNSPAGLSFRNTTDSRTDVFISDAGDVGISTIAPVGLFTVGASTGITVLSNGHVEAIGVSSAGQLASCGTGPTIVGNDVAGKITLGTGGATGCVFTFANAWTNAPACVVTNETTANLFRATSTTSQVTFSGTGLGSDVLAYHCMGYR